MPEGVTVEGSPFEKLQTQFEQILVHHSLLKEGVEAVADEIGKSMREGSANAAQGVRESTSEYVTSSRACAYTDGRRQIRGRAPTDGQPTRSAGCGTLGLFI